ncbi:25S rRNA (adenine645-N1)-methyltransferase [Mycoemilia scoparia]|uniref:Ribosomal RNA-processing protein 8 n=1 Tax=Mycoemilia scoparia TaxID=417184 RepID=A0A9W7ZRQ8_9FUNG|nr:25S rRNA (adenine645-N1)-methyltransferase [Mycoemilia scoparia]
MGIKKKNPVSKVAVAAASGGPPKANALFEVPQWNLTSAPALAVVATAKSKTTKSQTKKGAKSNPESSAANIHAHKTKANDETKKRKRNNKSEANIKKNEIPKDSKIASEGQEVSKKKKIDPKVKDVYPEEPKSTSEVPVNNVVSNVQSTTRLNKKQEKRKRLKEMLKKKEANIADTPASIKDKKHQHQSATSSSSTSSSSKPIESPQTKQPAQTQLTELQLKMREKLKGARFRWINEQLYTTTSQKAYEMMQNEPSMFDEYHQGFASQVSKWPTNPVNVFISDLEDIIKSQSNSISSSLSQSEEKQKQKKKKKQTEKTSEMLVVADMGCGEAKIAQELYKSHKKDVIEVHSFDLVKGNEFITPCDISNVPLPDGSVDIVIFCLSLMGVNWIDFIREAKRILKPKGELKVAEVVSRFADLDSFLSRMKAEGFRLTKKASRKSAPDGKKSAKGMVTGPGKKYGKKHQGKAHGHDDGDGDGKEEVDPSELLKPCIYKRR